MIRTPQPFRATGEQGVQQVSQVNRPTSAVSSGNAAPTAAARNLFVINLCAATSPVALAPPDHAGLKRFTFFMSRRREEGRERFRLHMGYFETQEEAERLLDIVREIYPGAWAGLAPGQRLRAAQAVGQAPAQSPTPDEMTFASPELEAARGASLPAQAPASAAPPAELALLPDAGPAIVRQADLPDTEQEAAVRALSDVRAVIASLEDTGSSEDAVPGPATLRVIPELKPPPSAQGAVEISDRAALHVLEGDRRTPARSASAGEVLKPAAVAQPGDERAAFAVQLIWSVQPIDMTKIPQLAIFSAYTLYGAEGNREGRRWYGVRLGFFTDAVSAKQVAHYVRSDFSTVSVVPVTPSERARAQVAAAQAVSSPISAPAAPAPSAAPGPIAKDNFEFIDDAQAKSAALTHGARARTGSGPPGKRAKFRSTRQINGRTRAKPLTLEETLEILGAGQLEIDDGRAATINDTAGQRRLPERRRSSRLGRLLERLSERLGT
jgi:hypothetical protein